MARLTSWLVTGVLALSVMVGQAYAAEPEAGVEAPVVEASPAPKLMPAWLKIDFVSTPQSREDRSLLLSYRIRPTDGLEKVSALITLDAEASDYLPTSDRMQEIALPLPPASTFGRLTAPINLTDHPWAGSKVFIRLIARNRYGQNAESAVENIVLPALPFKNPTAIQLLKLRALLYTAPELRIYVRRMLWQMLHVENALPDDPALVLALGMARNSLAPGEPLEKQQDVVQLLWETALRTEARHGALAGPDASPPPTPATTPEAAPSPQ